MKRLFFLLLTIVMGAGLVFLLNCGGDDKPTSSSKKTGNPDDSTFQIVQGLAGEGNFGLNMLILGINFELIDSIPTPEKTIGKIALPVQDGLEYIKIVEYHASNYWHIFECSVLVVDEGNSSFALKGIDSLRFGTADGYAYYPDSASITSLNIRAHFRIGLSISELQSADMAIHASYDLTGTYGGDFTLNGHETDSVDMSLAYINNVPDTIFCTLGMYYGETITDLVIDSIVQEDAGCPPSGSVSFNFALDFGCDSSTPLDSLRINGNWMANFTFADGNVTMVYENATTRWTVTDQCRDTTAKRSWAAALAALKR